MKTRKNQTGIHGTSTRALPAPDVQADLLPDAEGNLTLLPAEAAKQTLLVKVPMWEGIPTEESRHVMQGFWNETGLGSASFPQLPTPDQLQFQVHANRLTEGRHEVWYQVTIDGVDQGSVRVPITIDLSAPELGTPNALVFPPQVVNGGVTLAYLNANNDKLDATLPDYQTPQVGDTITGYWDTAEDENHAAATRKLGPGETTPPIVLSFSGEAIKASGNGTRKARYVVSDLAGNVSDHADYVDLRVNLEPVQDGLAPPEFDPRNFADLSDHTLWKDVIEAGNGLEVWIPKYRNLPITDQVHDTVYLLWAKGDDEVSAQYEVVGMLDVYGPPEAITFPLRITLIDQYLRPDGPLLVAYRVQTWNGATVDSPAVTVIADNTPPYANDDPARPVLPTDPITDEYLEARPEGVPWTLPQYAGHQPGDRVYFWWLNTLPDNPTDLPPTGSAEVTTSPMQLHVPLEAVKATGDGGCYLVYVLIDKATNQSRLSVYSGAVVALGPLPDELKPPVVPLAEDGLLDLLDAFSGVMVGIPAFKHWKPTDRVEVIWGTTVLPDEEIGSAPEFPLFVRIPEVTLRAEYGNAEGEITVPVSYRILRGGWSTAAQTIDVQVDFSVIGPPLPEWPNPVNPDVGLCEVWGEVSQQRNTLTRDDTGKDAVLKFPMYAPAEAGQVVEFYWGEVLVDAARYEVQGDEPAGTLIDVVIPWEVIAQAGNQPTLDVHYRFSDPQSPNEQRSPMTQVSVDAVVITPQAPTFPHAQESGLGPMLNCDALQGPEHSLHVQVPDLSALLGAGDVVTLTWTPYRGHDAQEELPEAVLTEAVTLTAEQVNGFIWEVKPYEDHILPTYDELGGRPAGYAKIHYTLHYGGHDLHSLESGAVIGMFDGYGSCPLALDD